jgi:hypothetical protein
MLSSKLTRSQSGSVAGVLRDGPPWNVARVKVTLLEIVPPIWRRLRIPVHLTLRRFHTVIQESMGWRDARPHRFRVGENAFGNTSDPAEAIKDSRWVTVQDVVAAGFRTFHYEYGSTDPWVHAILVEALDDARPENQRPYCLSGERACPPEESNSPDDYVDRIVAGRGPYAKPGFWPHERFDPERFDVERVNAALAALNL